MDIWSCKSLKSVNLSVPIAVRAGHSVTLECDYDLEGAPLYSVKWYYGDSEFYRYVPKEEPPTRVFPLRGMHVDVSGSNARNVTLLTVGRQLSGIFKCEVSADAPLFHTEIRSAKMVVAVVPNGAPVVRVDKSKLEQGGPLIAECTAPPAYPAPNLTWFVNDQKVPGSTSTSIRIDKDLLETATGKLELTGAGGTWVLVRLKCEASVFRLYRASSIEVSVKPESPKPQPASILLMESTSNGCCSTTNRQDHLYLCIVLCLTVMVLVRQQMIVS
ncbi:uncharacterized protein LOC108739465 isoform X2 [Agrilus planipennis]|uniref:Uncharacterized protein LOC108739465 isoform X2 n=1 Tax=Agrilus planipennis TaxID=224129 RepID=A0A1W4X907_AGRPL|nr:uncharacterized protein LOC108739465 isoform X2 [Agrilus planipennis]